MVSAVDTGPLIRVVSVEGTSYQVYGITFEDLVPMLDRFPEFRRMLAGPRPGEENVEALTLTFDNIIKMGPKIIGAIIAATIGKAGDESTEKWASRLTIGYQIKFIRETIEITFPGGLGPFVEDLKAMGLLNEKSSSTRQLDGTGKVLDMSSQSPSTSSSATVTREL